MDAATKGSDDMARKSTRPATAADAGAASVALSTGNKPLMRTLQGLRSSGAAGVHADQTRRGHSRRNRRAANAALRSGRYDD